MEKRETIKEVLMRRDGMNEDEAQALIDEAYEAFQEYIDDGDMESVEDICMDYFGLEPDYLEEFI